MWKVVLDDRRLFWLMAALWVILAWQVVFIVKGSGYDFDIFHTAGRRFLAGQQVYRNSEWDPYKYSPGATFLFVPFTLLQAHYAYVLWNVCMGLCMAVALTSLTRELPQEEKLAANLVVGGLVAVYAHFGFGLGQCDAFVLMCAALFWRWRDSRPFLGGLFMSAAVMLKLPYLAIAGLAVLFGRWRQAAGVAVGCALFVGAALVYYGWEQGIAQHEMWRQLLKDSTPRISCYKDNQSLWTWFCENGKDESQRHIKPIMMLVATVFMAHASAVILVWRKNRALAEQLAFALAAHVALAFSPLGWRANHLMMAVPLALAWRVRARWAFVPMLLLCALNYEMMLHNRKLVEQLMTLRLIGILSLVSALALSVQTVRRAILPSRLETGDVPQVSSAT